MVGEISAAGDIATGALLGRTMEPRAGEHPHGMGGALCLNCGTRLTGEFCHRCGQPGHVHSTLSSIGHDILHGAFHVEGKIWRTLPMLITRPGALTRRYVAGERARFVSPLALFLFCVFLMFAALHATAGEIHVPDDTTAGGRSELLAKLDNKIIAERAKLAQAKADLAKARITHENLDDASDEVEGRQTTLNTMLLARQAAAAGKATVKVQHFDTGWKQLDDRAREAFANPNLAIYKLQTNAYKFSWALIPISVPFVALLFLWRRGFKMYDHAIFVTYSLDFMTLLVSALVVAGAIGVPTSLISIVGTVAPPLHMYKQLRGAYRLRRFSAAWRMIALLVFAFCALMAFAAFLMLLGILE